MTIGDSTKRKTPSTSSSTGTNNTNRSRRSRDGKGPVVATTKATAARAAAIRSNTLNNATSLSKPPLKRKATTSLPSSSSPANGKKKRPQWDIRGRVQDMEDQLKKDRDQIGELKAYREGLACTAEEKEIEIKEVIQRIAEAKADLQAVQRKNVQELENAKAQQRIRVQELEDNNLIYKRKIASLELELGDNKRKMEEAEKLAAEETEKTDKLKKTIADSSASFIEIKEQIRSLKLKLERSDDILMEREKEIEKLTVNRNNAKEAKDRIADNVNEEELVHQRLNEKIRELASRADHDSTRQRKKNSLAT